MLLGEKIKKSIVIFKDGETVAFNTENRKIADLYQRPCRYVIPRYQREYVWKESNWHELLTDVKFTIQAKDKMKWSHFLGTIVLNSYSSKKKSEKIEGIVDYEIIDGQQRITTVYMMLLALYKQFKNIDSEASKKRAEYINSTFIVSLSADSEQIIMIDNPELDSDIKEVIDASRKAKLLSRSNKMYNLFKYFSDEFESYDFSALDTFLNRLLEINVVEIISDQEEEIYNIFEVLNARGQKLKQIELLKNHIMKYIQPRQEDFIDEAKEKWTKIIENNSHLSDIDNLINHFTKCYIKKNAENANSVYKLIKEEVAIEELAEFLEDLFEYSEAYSSITDTNSTDPTIEYFNIKRNQQVRSMLAAIRVLYCRGIIPDTVYYDTFLNLRNFFFIFNATQQTSNRIDKMMSDAAYELYHSKSEIDFKFILNEFFLKIADFINKENFNSIFYTNQSFRYSTKDSRLKRNSRLVKYILVEYYKMTQNDSVLDPKQLTIEHLYGDNGYSENSLLSNLTLTTGSINSDELANKNVEEKIAILKEKSSIKANQILDLYLVNGELDREKRGDDIRNELYESCFKFHKDLFGLNKSDIDQYKKNKNLIIDISDLEDLLYSSGKYFEEKLEKDPKYALLKEQYYKLLNVGEVVDSEVAATQE